MPKLPIKRRPTAVGCYIFAGGFTVGVRQAGFDVLCHLEGDGGYGVPTFKKNFPDINAYFGPSKWPDELLKQLPTIDFVYGNPPCAAWSNNNFNSHSVEAWKDDPRVDCTRQHFGLLSKIRPTVWAWESVTQTPVKGAELVKKLTALALKMGYAVTQVFHDARYLGVPQRRKRWFMVCHRVELDFSTGLCEEISAVDRLSTVSPVGPPAYDSMSNKATFDSVLHGIPAGKRLRNYWQEVICPPDRQTIKPNGHVLGRPGFGHIRLPDHGPATATVGYSMVHPTEHRFLSVNEVAMLAGYPNEYQFLGGKSGAAQLDLIARGVCPPVGKWLADIVTAGLIKSIPAEVKTTTINLTEKFHGEPMTKKSAESVKKIPAIKTTGSKNSLQGRLGVPGSKPQDLNRKYDVTQLKETTHGKRVNRDYAAHFFRWGWASRFVKGGKTKVLDIGCGQDLPLIKILTASLSTVPISYVGVDLNKIEKKTSISWVKAVIDNFDFVDDGYKYVKKRYGQFDLITCFEVIEHMHSTDGRRLLVGLRQCLTADGKILLSTPVYNGIKMAANHIHEWTIPELTQAVKATGLTVIDRFGTFANWNDIRKVCTKTEKDLLSEVGRFYGGDVLACFLAPKYPDVSRNNVWVLQRRS